MKRPRTHFFPCPSGGRLQLPNLTQRHTWPLLALLLAAAVLCGSLTACKPADDPVPPAPTPEQAEPDAPTGTPLQYSTYRDVLRDGAYYRDARSHQTQTTCSFFADWDEEASAGTPPAFSRFALADLDRNGTSELVAQHRDAGETYTVFWLGQDGCIWGDTLTAGTTLFDELKADGSFLYQDGAAQTSAGNTGVVSTNQTTALARMVLTEQGGTLVFSAVCLTDVSGSKTCQLYGEPAAEADFQALLTEQQAKSSVQWQDFTYDALTQALPAQPEDAPAVPPESLSSYTEKFTYGNFCIEIIGVESVSGPLQPTQQEIDRWRASRDPKPLATLKLYPGAVARVLDADKFSPAHGTPGPHLAFHLNEALPQHQMLWWRYLTAGMPAQALTPEVLGIMETESRRPLLRFTYAGTPQPTIPPSPEQGIPRQFTADGLTLLVTGVLETRTVREELGSNSYEHPVYVVCPGASMTVQSLTSDFRWQIALDDTKPENRRAAPRYLQANHLPIPITEDLVGLYGGRGNVLELGFELVTPDASLFENFLLPLAEGRLAPQVEVLEAHAAACGFSTRQVEGMLEICDPAHPEDWLCGDLATDYRPAHLANLTALLSEPGTPQTQHSLQLTFDLDTGAVRMFQAAPGQQHPVFTWEPLYTPQALRYVWYGQPVPPQTGSTETFSTDDLTVEVSGVTRVSGGGTSPTRYHLTPGAYLTAISVADPNRWAVGLHPAPNLTQSSWLLPLTTGLEPLPLTNQIFAVLDRETQSPVLEFVPDGTAAPC